MPAMAETSIEVLAMATAKEDNMDLTSSTLSVSTSEGDEGNEDQGVENKRLGNHPTLPPPRFVLKDDCEPPSPIRRMSMEEAADCVVVLNTRHSLLVTDTDTEGEEDDDDADYEASDELTELGHGTNRSDLVNLSFHLEMEAHAREGDEVVVSAPVLSENEAVSDRPSVSLPPRRRLEDKPRQESSMSSRPASILDTVAEGLVDTLCHSSSTCAGHTASLPPSAAVISESTIQQDILQVMGCSLPPDEDEIAHLWDLETALQLTCSIPSQPTARVTYSHPNSPKPARPTGPHRPGPRERIMRLRQWRKERSLVGPSLPGRTYSVDHFESHKDRRAHPVDDKMTYDSDPEMSVSMRSKKRSNKTTRQRPTTPQRNARTLRWTVREGMNQKWDLVWHTETTSVPVRAWMERGTVVGQQMLEPSLVWKDTSDRCTQLRFLNICRVLPATTQDQRKSSILARPSYTVRLLTSTGEEYFLETSSTTKRTEIVNTWKTCIARFATLAVLEDLDSIQNEFFSPESHSYVPDVEKTMQDLDRDERNDI